jgi:hypothetical protein
MFALLGLAFACLGAAAIAAIVVTLRRCVPLVTELHNALKEPLPSEELRLTVHKAVQLEVQPTFDSERPKHQPKSIKRLLQARERNPAAA